MSHLADASDSNGKPRADDYTNAPSPPNDFYTEAKVITTGHQTTKNASFRLSLQVRAGTKPPDMPPFPDPLTPAWYNVSGTYAADRARVRMDRYLYGEAYDAQAAPLFALAMDARVQFIQEATLCDEDTARLALTNCNGHPKLMNMAYAQMILIQSETEQRHRASVIWDMKDVLGSWALDVPEGMQPQERHEWQLMQTSVAEELGMLDDAVRQWGSHPGKQCLYMKPMAAYWAIKRQDFLDIDDQRWALWHWLRNMNHENHSAAQGTTIHITKRPNRLLCDDCRHHWQRGRTVQLQEPMPALIHALILVISYENPTKSALKHWSLITTQKLQAARKWKRGTDSWASHVAALVRDSDELDVDTAAAIAAVLIDDYYRAREA